MSFAISSLRRSRPESSSRSLGVGRLTARPARLALGIALAVGASAACDGDDDGEDREGPERAEAEGEAASEGEEEPLSGGVEGEPDGPESDASSVDEGGELRLGATEIDLPGVRYADTALADLDGSGDLDLVIADSGATRIALGQGDGSFEFTEQELERCWHCSISVADLDGDGNLDLLVNGDLYVGNGDGTFEESGANLVDVNRAATAVGDVDGDGNLDLVIAGRTDEPVAALYLGDGEGGFEEAEVDLVGVRDGTASLADFNESGDKDLLLTGQDAEEEPVARLYLGDGDGDFQEAGAGLEGVYRSSASVADVNGSGHLDVLLTGWGYGNTTTLYLGDGKGGFEEAGAGLTDVESGASAFADFDGDGNLDLAITGEAVTSEGQVPVAVLYLGDGEGGFEKSEARLAGAQDGSIAVGDVDGDGTKDLLITGEGEDGDKKAQLYLGGGQAGFAPSAEPYYVDRELEPRDLRGLGLRSLSLLRNTIFARAGTEFDTPWLNEHFRGRAWYEPGGFDDEAISARDRQNVEVIRSFEERLGLDELLARRALHWAPHGEPDGDWEFPGPFDEKEAREAALLDARIAARRDAGEEPGEAEIPSGFVGGPSLGGGAADLPDGLAPPGAIDWVRGRAAAPAANEDAGVPRGGAVGGFFDAEEQLEQVFAEPPPRDVGVPLDGVPASMNNARLSWVVEPFGEPADYGDLTTFPREPMRWEGQGRVAELTREARHGGAVQTYLFLHEGDPTRVCGPEDGFEDFYESFETAVTEGDVEAAAEHFHFPFEDRGMPTVASAEEREAIDRSFETEEAFLSEVSEGRLGEVEGTGYGSLALAAERDPPSCIPSRGYTLRIPGAGRYVFQRVGGDWKATMIAH